MNETASHTPTMRVLSAARQIATQFGLPSQKWLRTLPAATVTDDELLTVVTHLVAELPEELGRSQAARAVDDSNATVPLVRHLITAGVIGLPVREAACAAHPDARLNGPAWEVLVLVLAAAYVRARERHDITSVFELVRSQAEEISRPAAEESW